MQSSTSKPALYLVRLSFISGEYEQDFQVCIPARSLGEAEKLLQNFLLSYYSRAHQENEHLYQYYNWEVAVKVRKIEELPDSKEEAFDYLVSVLSV